MARILSREKARNPHSLLWGGMASGGLGAAAPIMAFSLESPLDNPGEIHLRFARLCTEAGEVD